MAKSSKKDDDWDSDANEVVSNWVKWNVPMEDKVFGTFIEKRTMASTLPGANGKMVNVYEMKVDMGTFHILDEKKKVVDEPVVLSEGDFVSIGGTAVIDRQMQNARKGQKLGFKFIEEKPSKTKGFAPAKIVKVYMPKDEATGDYQMDEKFLEEQVVKEF